MAIFLLIILWLALKDLSKSTLVVTGFYSLFFSYGHVSNLVKDIDIWRNQFILVRFLGLIWFVMLLIWVWFILKKVENESEVNVLFSLIGLALLIFPLVKILGLTQLKKDLGGDLGWCKHPK
jgi:hypothetical protein